MRTLWLALISLNAAACPDLDGVFGCTNQDGSVETIKIYRLPNQVPPTYQYNQTQIVADNQVHPVRGDEDLHDGRNRSWCDDEVLRTELLGQYVFDNEYKGDLRLETILSRDGEFLRHSALGQLSFKGINYPLRSVRVCIKMTDAVPPVRAPVK